MVSADWRIAFGECSSARLDTGAFGQVHFAAEERLELLFHANHVEERVARAVLERDQHVDVAVRAEVVAQDGAEKRQLRHLPALAEGGDPFGGYGDSGGHGGGTETVPGQARLRSAATSPGVEPWSSDITASRARSARSGASVIAALSRYLAIISSAESGRVSAPRLTCSRCRSVRPSVVRTHLARIVGRKRRVGIDAVADLVAEREHRRVGVGLRLELGQGETPAREHARDHVVGAELGLVGACRAALGGLGLAHHADAALADQGVHALDIGGREPVLVAQRLRRIAQRVDQMAGRVGLDADAQHLPVLAEAGGAHRPVDLRIVGAVERVEAEAPLVGLGRAPETLLGQGRSADPANRRPAGVHPLGPGAVVQELQAARRHAERDALGVRELRLGHAGEPAGGQRRAEHADHAGGVEAQTMEAALRRSGDPRRALDGHEIGFQHRATRGAVPLAGGHHRRHRARRGVDHAADVGVVVVEAVDQEAVHLRGIAQRQPRRHPDDGIGPVAGKPVDGGQRLVAEIVTRGREADAHRIEDVQLGALDHRVGHVVER